MKHFRRLWRWLHRPIYLVKPIYPMDIILYVLLSGVTFSGWLWFLGALKAVLFHG